MDLAFNYVKDHQIGLQADYPYKGKDGKCTVAANGTRFPLYAYEDVAENVESALVTAVSTGPVSVAINASGLGF
jgi:hypothetical protein